MPFGLRRTYRVGDPRQRVEPGRRVGTRWRSEMSGT